MGRQINYWMDYKSFLNVAQTAVECGCIIVRNDINVKKPVQSKDISIVTEDCKNYFFYLPEAGRMNFKKYNDGREVADKGFTETGNAVIEAGFSYIRNDSKKSLSAETGCMLSE